MCNRTIENSCSLSISESDILCILSDSLYLNQRSLAERTGYSLGNINQALRRLKDLDLIDDKNHLTDAAQQLISNHSPRQAVILAAGFGMRMVPINLTSPKALLEVKGEILIERLIRQLREAGIEKITVVAGFMKDCFEYLIDDFGIQLAVCEQYAVKNNLHSLSLVSDCLENAYVIPCDLWIKENLFRKHELYSWYMVSDEMDSDSPVRINRKGELIRKENDIRGNHMIGICYLTQEDGAALSERLRKMDQDPVNDDAFWEEALFDKKQMTIKARCIKKDLVTEINTYEQLRELDRDSEHLHSGVIRTIAEVLDIREEDITDIEVLKKGMTNRSFLFQANGRKYIMRIPGEGTDHLINRKQEAEVYRTISGKGFCDDPVYIDSETGYKITEFLENVRVCDTHNDHDLKRCMTLLRSFHQSELQVEHTFDLFGQILFYESLWDGEHSVFRDYEKTKANVWKLKEYIDSCEKKRCLTHIDAVPDNFLFYIENGQEKLQLTDWEYAGMQDPHVDIAMFCIYSMYSKEESDHLIDLYFDGKCDNATRKKIYCYIAVCGLLWSNWCEYKRKLGVEFGEYSIRQYRYAKEYFRYAEDFLNI